MYDENWDVGGWDANESEIGEFEFFDVIVDLTVIEEML
jgi:hypothetical protein